MENIELIKLQEKVLGIAKYFVDFCKKNNITCYFCGGGCIGAIRHGDFIPWDDDLDFFVPRKDYEKLKLLWNQEEHPDYILAYPQKDYMDHNIFMTLRDRRTTLIKPYQENLDIAHGVAIDIFPIDFAPTDKFQRKIQLFWAMVFQLFCAQLVPINYGLGVKWLAKIILGFFRLKKIRYYIWSFAEKQMSKYSFDNSELITELCAGPKYMTNIYPKEAFEKAVEKTFRNTIMPIPVGYDCYLKIAFGDYMKLPPKEHRRPHHDALFMDLDVSYEQYRKVYYLRENK